MQRQTQLYEMTPEDQLRMEYADIRCLKICIALLERVNNVSESVIPSKKALKLS